MIIRTAREEDIPAIVELLKLSLGESLMPKSEAYWRWKHVENPFGPSPVLLAEEDGQLIGVRAFMRWEWTDGNKVIKAVRAVDTATHPQHQGKGIFKKLTLRLVEQCTKEGVEFVFNTPNDQSRPGYLKMGWQVAGKLPIRVALVNPLRSGAMEAWNLKEIWSSLPEDFSVEDPTAQKWRTHISKRYLKWRYEAVPVVEYFGRWDSEQKSLLIFRIKKNRWGSEMRLVEVIGSLGSLYQLLPGRAVFSTLSGCRQETKGWSLPFGPVVTVRDLRINGFPNELMHFTNWQPSLGDLELF